MKDKAERILENMSNERLESLLRQFGYNNSVNMFTRVIIESKIKDKLSSYTELQIEEFIKKFSI